MLDFRRHRRALKHPGPALERRILALLVGMGLVVLLIVGAGNPGNWRWIVPDRPPAAGQQRVAGEPGRVVIAAAGPRPDDGPTDEPQDAVAEVVEERLFSGVRADYLNAVRDDTEFRPTEADGWFHLFALLERTPNEKLVTASEGRVSYLQLDQQPRAYRGHVVTVGGVARAAKRVTAPENAFAVKQYYQLWLQPNRDSDELIVVYFLDLPDGFPLGPQIEAECSAAGFFFKRWAYRSRGGIATAPLVIAKTLDWQPPPTEERPPAPPLAERLMTAVFAALVLAAMLLVFAVWRGRATMKTRRAVRKQDAVDDDRARATLASLEEDRHETLDQ